jgi:polysaccharide biosynthesis transport protein
VFEENSKTTMELIQYFILFRRWFWLIFLAALVAGGAAFIRSSNAMLMYEAQTQILIGGFIQEANPDASSITTGKALANTYAELIKTNDVLQATSDALGGTIPPDDLRSIISANIKQETSLMVVTAIYSDPILVADIANEVSQQLVLASPTNLTSGQQAQVDFADEQITTLTDDLEHLRLTLDQIDEQIAATEDSEELSVLSEQRNVQVNQINLATATIAQFSNTIVSLQRRSNSLDIVETATIADSPVGGNARSSIILSALVGASLAGGVILLIEYLNDKIRLSSEIAESLAVPVLGVVSRFSASGDDYKDQVITTGLVFSNTVEEYRTMRVNLLFSTANNEGKRYLITSPSPKDGKSVTATNLAVSMAMDNKRVLLVDADLRRPSVHHFFGLNNEMGLSSLLTISPNGATPQMNDAPWEQYVQDSGIPNLWVIPSGFTPKNPIELLGSVALHQWLSVIEQSLDIDVVLFDTAPCLLVSDSVTLAATTHTQVILVVRAGVTRHNAAVRAKERFAHIGQDIIGVVLNQANPRDESYSGYYGYGYYGYSREDGE